MHRFCFLIVLYTLVPRVQIMSRRTPQDESPAFGMRRSALNISGPFTATKITTSPPDIFLRSKVAGACNERLTLQISLLRRQAFLEVDLASTGGRMLRGSAIVRLWSDFRVSCRYPTCFTLQWKPTSPKFLAAFPLSRRTGPSATAAFSLENNN